jgi:hypothetical protein
MNKAPIDKYVQTDAVRPFSSVEAAEVAVVATEMAFTGSP